MVRFRFSLEPCIKSSSHLLFSFFFTPLEFFNLLVTIILQGMFADTSELTSSNRIYF